MVFGHGCHFVLCHCRVITLGQSSLQYFEKENRPAGSGNTPTDTRDARDSCLWPRKTRNRELPSTQSSLYSYPNENRLLVHSLDPLDLFDRQWNFAGDYLEWLYFYPGRSAQSRCLDCLNQLSPTNLGRVNKTSHAHQFTQPVLYFCQAN